MVYKHIFKQYHCIMSVIICNTLHIPSQCQKRSQKKTRYEKLCL